VRDVRRVRGRIAIVLALLAARVLLGEGGFAPIQAQVMSQAGEWPFGPNAHGHEHHESAQPGANLAAQPADDGGNFFKDAAAQTLLGAEERERSGLTPPTTASAQVPAPLVVPTSPPQWFAPSGRNGGTEGIANYLSTLALTDNKPLYVSDVWGRTGGGANSDHHVSQVTSWAVDLAVRGIQQPTPATETAAARIASALGEPGWPGGNLTKTVDGYRIQVLWKVAGHYNHVHVGIRKL
jgi:hypothetical protein